MSAAITEVKLLKYVAVFPERKIFSGSGAMLVSELLTTVASFEIITYDAAIIKNTRSIAP